MTNPDNVGGLVWYVCTSCMLMVQLPSDTPTLGRCQCSPKGWSLRRAKLPKGYELCRAAPARGDVPSWRNVDSAIDAKALATATEIALMWGNDRSQFVSRIQVAVIDAMRWMGDAQNPVSAPAGSGEVDALLREAREVVEADFSRRRATGYQSTEAVEDLLFRIDAALLRKLQQGAAIPPHDAEEYRNIVFNPDERTSAIIRQAQAAGWNKCRAWLIAAAQDQEGGK